MGKYGNLKFAYLFHNLVCWVKRCYEALQKLETNCFLAKNQKKGNYGKKNIQKLTPPPPKIMGGGGVVDNGNTFAKFQMRLQKNQEMEKKLDTRSWFAVHPSSYWGGGCAPRLGIGSRVVEVKRFRVELVGVIYI